MTEIEQSSKKINKLYGIISKEGFHDIHAIPMHLDYSGDKPVLTLLENHHTFRACYEYSKECGENLPINVVIYPSNFISLSEASRQMCAENKEGATPWYFLDIVRSLHTTRSKRFLELLAKYGNAVGAIAVIANATLNADCSASRSKAEKNFGVKGIDGIWGNAEDYLQFVSKINAGKKISEEMGNAMRELYNIALKYNPNVLDMFKGFFTEKPFNFVFKSCGRPRKKQWLNKLVSTMKAEYTKSEVYRNAKPYHKDLFRQFLWEVVNTTDYNNDYANVI